MAPQMLPASVTQNLALAVIASSAAPVLLLDRDLIVVAASASFCRVFHYEGAGVAGLPLAMVGKGEWNVPQLGSLLNNTANGYAEIQDYEMDLMQGSGARRLVVNARKLQYGPDEEVRLLLSVADVTDARAAEKLKADLLREKDVLLQELHHRVANSLQIIASVLMQSARKVQSEESRIHLVDAHQRVMSVAALQQQLAGTRRGDVELRPYFTALCDSIGASMIRDHDQISLHVTADDSLTTADTSVSLGLIVTELVINALKHAFPNDRAGRIVVDYRSPGSDWTLSVGDDGVGMPQSPHAAKAGLGTSIVQALAAQLGATVDVTSRKPGTRISTSSTPMCRCWSAPKRTRFRRFSHHTICHHTIGKKRPHLAQKAGGGEAIGLIGRLQQQRSRMAEVRCFYHMCIVLLIRTQNGGFRDENVLARPLRRSSGDAVPGCRAHGSGCGDTGGDPDRRQYPDRSWHSWRQEAHRR